MVWDDVKTEPVDFDFDRWRGLEYYGPEPDFYLISLDRFKRMKAKLDSGEAKSPWDALSQMLDEDRHEEHKNSTNKSK